MQFFRYSSFDPGTLNLLHRAHAEACDELRQSGGYDVDDVRTTLASRIMGLAATGERDVAALKRYALRGISPSVKADMYAH